MKGSVVELTGHDHGVQYAIRRLSIFAETSVDIFDRNLGDELDPVLHPLAYETPFVD